MWVHTGERLVNLDNITQITVEATEVDTWALVASKDDADPEAIILGEYGKWTFARHDMERIKAGIINHDRIVWLYRPTDCPGQ